MNPNTLTVPIEALSLDAMEAGDGAGESKVSPQAGDPVEVMCTGVLEGVDGAGARIRIETVNGTPIVPEVQPGGNQPKSEDELLAMAAQADQAAGYGEDELPA